MRNDIVSEVVPPATLPDSDTGCGCGDGIVLRQDLVIRNSRGLHARAAAKLVTLAERYSACLHVVKDGQKVPACSIMGLMMLGAGAGSHITIEAEGWDAKEALEAVAGLVEAGFHED
ncbi:HPr family phosphocarrier protein [Siccirubricoccus soli]|uniref:HPr family phosphocarrier protein n=1 Tax=Siccirubricoccus soli TaxID=2899147 RepID=UPI00273A5BD4|nr:HPr family phosphocarrier protein [Siccirubricoccus soli]